MGYINDPQVQTMIDNLPDETGKSLEEWFALIETQKRENFIEILKLLKRDHGVPHGYANTISMMYRQKLVSKPTSQGK